MSVRPTDRAGERSRNAIIAAISAYHAQHKQSLTVNEIADATGLSRTNVRHHVAALVASGIVHIVDQPVRRVRHEVVLTDAGRTAVLP